MGGEKSIVSYLVESVTCNHLDRTEIFPQSLTCSVKASLWVQNPQGPAVQITKGKKEKKKNTQRKEKKNHYPTAFSCKISTKLRTTTMNLVFGSIIFAVDLDECAHSVPGNLVQNVSHLLFAECLYKTVFIWQC